MWAIIDELLVLEVDNVGISTGSCNTTGACNNFSETANTIYAKCLASANCAENSLTKAYQSLRVEGQIRTLNVTRASSWGADM